MKQGRSAIIIMAKRPDVGKTKTRLCPPLTLTQAAELYLALLKDTIALASSIPEVDLALAISPSDSHEFFQSFAPPNTLLTPVEGPDIGVCLVQAMEYLLSLGYSRAAAMNSDGPTLPRSHLLQAFMHLHDDDLVIGPGTDGGYYLIGMQKMNYPLFDGIPWSTSQVFAQTLTRSNRLGLRTFVLPAWYDIDTGDDLNRLKSDLAVLPGNQLNFTRKALQLFDF